MNAATADGWLGNLVGEWVFDSEPVEMPDGSVYQHRGAESVRQYGPWFVCEATTEVPGSDEPHRSVMALGFDDEKGKVSGSFIGSMMRYLWIYEGSIDLSAQTLTLSTEGPSYTEEGLTARYRDTIEFHGPNERVMRSACLGSDGEWTEVVKVRYRRSS